ncbi:putative 28S ribosomal protein S6, mitochondrial [Amphibalanus amphitrite]|uniref:Putative 28S ribosomal protein S6, mitochondrial n=1 Tax=Amphibalanus amphitrite TaxID=1232801 RepID=A0A6A4W099_AMPAM|nr:putative 28S ribosomal protein S6, mitochondrial [Amphibalanus amphitrite]
MIRPALVQTVKRTAELVMDRGGYIRKVESLGTRALPSRMAAHGLRHSEGRAEVKQMLAAVEKKEQRQKKFKPNTKLDFYPFQR